jgi:UDP-glucose 4-epimerase
VARILLTGASSFSGLWIAEALAAAGHEVTAPLKRQEADYSGLRAERVARLKRSADAVFDAPFGSARFLDLAARGVDLLAHHAADIPNYRSADYDVMAGVARNTEGLEAVFRACARAGARAAVVTGTTFEAGEGGGGAGDLAVSPYGLSKTLTNEAARHFAPWSGLGFGKFVVAAPFGVLEEGRFAWSLFQAWFDGRPGQVRTPRYVRDNIPAPLLAAAYAGLTARLLDGAGTAFGRPAGFIGTQAAFAERLAAEMRPRLGLPCEVDSLPQPELAEPERRVNSDPAIPPDWDAAAFWDDYAAYYRRLAETGRLAAPA